MTDPVFPEVIDSSMRSDFVSCEHKFFESYIMKRQRKGGSIHLVAGGAYARGHEIIRTLVWGPDKAPVEDAIQAAIPYVLAEFGDFETPAGYEHKSPERVIGALVAYYDRFPPETDHIQPMMKKNGMPAVEFTFSFPMQIKHPTTGNPILYAGRFDMIGRYQDTLWVVDDKTATTLGTAWEKSWRLRGQLTGYVFACQQFGYPVVGSIIRGISMLKSGAYGFSEPIENRPAWTIERWWNQLHRDVARMIGCWEDRDEDHPYGYWGYNLAEACNSFGGCPFAQLCTVNQPENWLGEYETRTWNPLDMNPLGPAESVPSGFAS